MTALLTAARGIGKNSLASVKAQVDIISTLGGENAFLGYCLWQNNIAVTCSVHREQSNSQVAGYT